MSETISMWVISGISSINALLLAAIWVENRASNKKIEVIHLSSVEHNSRISYCEKTLDKLPCVENGFHCERTTK